MSCIRVFFFKQKTAYEMRISDWSSDVCSSDLIDRKGFGKHLFARARYNADGSENPDFVLNKPAYRNARILIAGDNFGCGSSREIGRASCRERVCTYV